MKTVITDTETIIYPMLSENDKETDEDFCLIAGNNMILVNNTIIDEDDIAKIIDALEVLSDVVTQD